MTNAQIVSAINTIQKIKSEDRDLPFKLSFALNKNFKNLIDVYKIYEQTLSEKGIVGLSEKQLNDLPKDKKEELNALRNTDVDITLFKVNSSDIGNACLSISEAEFIQNYMMEN